MAPAKRSAAKANVAAAAPESSAPTGARTRTCLLSQLHKTKFCMYHLKGACQYGEECAFAHSYVELQSPPDLRKTRLCTAFQQGKKCTDPGCSFAHGEDELRSTATFFRKTLCIWHEKGKCRNGDQCRFAHGKEQLRTPVKAPNPRGAANKAGQRQQKAAVKARQAPESVSGASTGSTASSLKDEPVKIPEPMKINVSAMGAAPPPVPPPGISDDDGSEQLREHLEQLRESLSALTMQCVDEEQGVTMNPYLDPMAMDMGFQFPMVPGYSQDCYGEVDHEALEGDLAPMFLGEQCGQCVDPDASMNFVGSLWGYSDADTLIGA